MRKYFDIPDIITDDFIIQNFKLKKQIMILNV